MSKWEREFKNGLPCNPEDVSRRRFKVKMRGWAWPFLHGNEKRFDEDGTGINVWRILWGLVVIKWGDYSAMRYAHYISLDYDQPDNAWYERRIIDILRLRASGDGYIGDFRICFTLLGRYWHTAWFTLTEIEGSRRGKAFTLKK